MRESSKKAKKTKVYKKCNCFNTGFCRNRQDCPFHHPQKWCDEHLDTGKCSKFRTCQQRHPRKYRFFKSDEGCFHGESCAYLHKEISTLNETSTNEETESDTVKLVTIEVNGNCWEIKGSWWRND